MEKGEVKPTVHVVGLGGVGFYCYLALLRAIDADRLVGWDRDNLSGGLGHARLPVASPETMKADLVRGFARVSMGDKPGITNKQFFTGAECTKGDIVVDCSDAGLESRREMWAKARAIGARCIRVSYDGEASTIVVAEGLPLETAGSNAGYASVPSLALSFAAGGIGAECVRLMIAKPDVYVENQVSLSEWLSKLPASA
jgi:hypothetical protein